MCRKHDLLRQHDALVIQDQKASITRKMLGTCLFLDVTKRSVDETTTVPCGGAVAGWFSVRGEHNMRRTLCDAILKALRAPCAPPRTH